MAYSIKIKPPKMEVLHSDVVFIVRDENRLLGRLKVSQGNLEWIPAGNSVNTFKIQWKDLDSFFKKRVKSKRKN